MNNSFLYKKAELMYENENYTQALQLFLQLDDVDINYDVQNYIGCCLLRIGQYKKAKEIFETISISNPNWSRPIYNLGQVYMMLNEYDKALMCFNNAIHINPNDADAYYYRGVFFEKIKDYNSAIIEYTKSISLKPNEFEPHLGLCICYDNIGDEQKALLEAKIAFEIFDCNNTLYNYTFILNKVKEYDSSYKVLQKHNAISSNDVGILKNLMFCSKKINKKHVCIACAKKILAQHPNDLYAKKIIIEAQTENSSLFDS